MADALLEAELKTTTDIHKAVRVGVEIHLRYLQEFSKPLVDGLLKVKSFVSVHVCMCRCVCMLCVCLHLCVFEVHLWCVCVNQVVAKLEPFSFACPLVPSFLLINRQVFNLPRNAGAAAAAALALGRGVGGATPTSAAVSSSLALLTGRYRPERKRKPSEREKRSQRSHQGSCTWSVLVSSPPLSILSSHASLVRVRCTALRRAAGSALGATASAAAAGVDGDGDGSSSSSSPSSSSSAAEAMREAAAHLRKRSALRFLTELFQHGVCDKPAPVYMVLQVGFGHAARQGSKASAAKASECNPTPTQMLMQTANAAPVPDHSCGSRGVFLFGANTCMRPLLFHLRAMPCVRVCGVCIRMHLCFLCAVLLCEQDSVDRALEGLGAHYTQPLDSVFAELNLITSFCK